MHIGWKLRQLARWYPDRPAIVDEAGTWTYAALLARLNRYGNAMAGIGLQRGDRIALMLPDIREYLEVDYGTMSAGFVRVPLDPRLTRAEIVSLLRHAEVRAIVAHSELGEKLAGLSDDVESLLYVISVGGPLPGAVEYESLLENASDADLAAGDDDDLATLNFSGGTTGAPKATMLLHRNLMTVVQNTVHAFGITPATTFLNVRPLWPIAQVILMSYVMAGATVVLGGRFQADNFVDLVRHTNARRTSLVPTQLVRLVEHLRPRDTGLDDLQAIHVGGSRIPEAVFERALDNIGPKVSVLYGLTEAPICCYLRPEDLDCDDALRKKRMSSVGRELFDYEVAVAAGDSATRDVGHEGEVLVRGGNVMAGYWKNAAATSAALRAGMLHTGDLGRFDEYGNLHIVGRLKDVIRSGSSSIVPKEVEDVISSHAAVLEVAVLGVPDPEWGEAVTAFVVLQPGASASESEIIEHCRSQLASYKKPKMVRFIDRLPRSHYGKVLQKQLLSSLNGAGS